MDTYSLLREFADSWFLIAMFSFFLGAAAFAFWPSLKPARDDAAAIPFREEPDAPSDTCDSASANCVCNTDFLKGASND